MHQYSYNNLLQALKFARSHTRPLISLTRPVVGVYDPRCHLSVFNT